MRRAVASAVPLIGDADAASESHLAICHQQPAMRSSIVFLPVVPLCAPEPANLAAGRLHSLQQRRGNFLRAVAIEDHPYVDATLRGVGEGGSEQVGDVSGLVHVRREMHAVARVRDCIQHRRKDLGAVLIEIYAV